MTATVDGQDLYVVLEREVRTPKERLLVDAFLPPPEALPSSLRRPAVPRPAPAEEPAANPGTVVTTALPGPDDDAGEPGAPPPRRRPARRVPETEKSLEEEIAEFMSRSNRALAPDPDPDAG